MKKTAFLNIFSEVENMKLEHDLAFATFCGSKSCWEGRHKDMVEAWKEQLCEATASNEVRGPEKAGCCELRDASIQWSAWDTFKINNEEINCQTIAPSDAEKHQVKRAKHKWWQRKQVAEMENGVWFETIRAFLRRRCNDYCSTKHSADAGSLIINGAVMQGSIRNHRWTKQNRRKVRDDLGTEKHGLYACSGWHHVE